MRLRWKLVLTLALAGLIPILPLLFSVSSAVRIGARTLAPEEIGDAIQTAFSIARMHMNRIETDMANRLDRLINANPDPYRINYKMIGSYLDSNEILYLKSENSYLKLSEEGWHTTVLSVADSAAPFVSVPRYIIVQQTTSYGTWAFHHKLDDDFLGKAEELQAANADWAMRSVERDRLIRSLVGTYLITYLLVVTLSIGAGLLVVISESKRVENLTRTAEAVAGGDEKCRAETRGSGEIRRLAATFNMMLDRLDESRLKAADMEKKAAWRELARVLAHEIKNPLTPIQLSIQQLADSYRGDDEEFHKTLNATREIINDEVESLRSLVFEFGDFAHAPQLEPDWTMPVDLISDISSLYGLRLRTEVEGGGKPCFIDREKIKRALINLVDNALAVIEADGEVVLRFYEEEKNMVFEVEDSGPGVEERNREAIFEPYYTTKRAGVGLGLPVVRTVADQHEGGVICLEGKTLGGALFRLWLPQGETSE